MTERIRMEGLQYGLWTVAEYMGRNDKGQPIYTCKCACGTLREVVAHSLRQGKSKSCGCRKGDAIAAGLRTHGQSSGGRETRTYKTWKAMHRRCKTKDPKTFRYYGAIGIKVCERWSSFENFFADMGEIPIGMTLDRINPFGNYEPGNCQWADWKTQRRNQRPHKRSVH